MFLLCSKLGMTYYTGLSPTPRGWQSQAESDLEARRFVEEEAKARLAAKAEKLAAQSRPPDPPPAPDISPQDAEAAAAPAAGVPPRVIAEDSPDEDDLAYCEPDPASDMHAWLVCNWDAIKALEAAGKLPELTPAEPSADDLAPEEEEPVPAAASGPPPYVARGDRWNKPKMAEFLRQLAATHSVSAAAKAVGMSRRSAYKLRARLKGQPFDIAWEAAFRHGYDTLAHSALELALEGEEVPHYYKGELKGTYRKRNPQLLVQLLKLRNRAGAPMLGRYNAAAEFWSENWDKITDRVETGSVTWDDERRALGRAELAKLELPDEHKQIGQIIERNRPDEPPKRR